MKGIRGALWAEFLKMRRSTAFKVTVGAVAILPMMMGLMMFILKNPALAKSLGLLGAKAQLVGTADWPSFFNMLKQGLAGMEMVIFGFVSSWVFGREYSDRTVKDLLALPVSRGTVVMAKLTVTLIWCVILFLFAFTLAILAGKMINLPGGSLGQACDALFILLKVSFIVVFLNTTVAFVASCTRGYMAALGLTIFAMVMVNFAMVLGYGQYYPWAIVMQYAAKGAVGAELGATSWIIVLITGLTGLVGTLAWWRYADQT